MIDEKLTFAAIDRIFIAVNYEETRLEVNDENKLCRYEFAEIITRMAKIKYVDAGKHPHVYLSVEQLITKHIIPNMNKKMEWQPFRDKHLWRLDIDDIIKANIKSFDVVYRKFATYGQKIVKSFSNTDAVKMLNQVMESFPESFQEQQQEQLQKVITAFAMAKMTLQDEIEEFYNYFVLNKVEFYEFIGRWADLLFQSSQIPFSKKYEAILKIILPVVGCKFKSVQDDDDIPSDSDYDDDQVEDIIQELIK